MNSEETASNANENFITEKSINVYDGDDNEENEMNDIRVVEDDSESSNRMTDFDSKSLINNDALQQEERIKPDVKKIKGQHDEKDVEFDDEIQIPYKYRKEIVECIVKGDQEKLANYLSLKDVNINMIYHSDNLLMVAIKNKQSDIAEYLINSGIDITYEKKIYDRETMPDIPFVNYSKFTCYQLAKEYNMEHTAKLIAQATKKKHDEEEAKIQKELEHMASLSVSPEKQLKSSKSTTRVSFASLESSTNKYKKVSIPTKEIVFDPLNSNSTSQTKTNTKKSNFLKQHEFRMSLLNKLKLEQSKRSEQSNLVKKKLTRQNKNASALTRNTDASISSPSSSYANIIPHLPKFDEKTFEQMSSTSRPFPIKTFKKLNNGQYKSINLNLKSIVIPFRFINFSNEVKYFDKKAEVLPPLYNRQGMSHRDLTKLNNYNYLNLLSTNRSSTKEVINECLKKYTEPLFPITEPLNEEPLKSSLNSKHFEKLAEHQPHPTCVECEKEAAAAIRKEQKLAHLSNSFMNKCYKSQNDIFDAYIRSLKKSGIINQNCLPILKEDKSSRSMLGLV